MNKKHKIFEDFEDM